MDVNHRHIWNILDNISQVLPSDIDVLHEINSSNFTFFVDLSDFELHQIEVVNVDSMVAEEVQRVDDFIDDNEIQYEDTLEVDMDDEKNVEYESDDETSKSETNHVYISNDDLDV